MNAASILISGCLFHYERREKRACLSARPIVRDRIVMMAIVAIKMTKMTRHRASARRTTEEEDARRQALASSAAARRRQALADAEAARRAEATRRVEDDEHA